MKRHFVSMTAAAVALILEGCLGSGGSSAPPPNNVVVTEKDSRVVVTWDMVPGIQYWLWTAAGTTVTPQTCSSLPLCKTLINVSSPASVSGLVNDQAYAFSINSRISGGPGGAGSPVTANQQAIPRLAGKTWSAGSTVGTTLRGVAYGTLNGTGTFVAVGDSGVSFSSTNGTTWTPLNPTGAPLNAVAYDVPHAKYLGVGAGGAIVALATSSTTWSPQTSPTPNPLYAVVTDANGFTIATGDAGRIITSGDGGTTWVPQSNTGKTLYGVAVGTNVATLQTVYVAVGAAGTILHSANGATWESAASGTPNDLKSVTYMATAGVFLAVGANGTVLTSSDGVTWAIKTSAGSPATSIPATVTLNAVTVGATSTNVYGIIVYRRFVAVGDDGNIYYSEPADAGAVWKQITPPWSAIPFAQSPLFAVTTGGLFDYSAVGTSGVNFYAD